MANESVRACVWREQHNNYVYCDSAIGSDSSNGQYLTPFKTITGMVKSKGSLQSPLRLRGYFSEEVKNSSEVHTVGNYGGHAFKGDFPGAAVFDGDNDTLKDVMNGCALTNIIVKNIPTKQAGEAGYQPFAGLGRPNNGNAVGFVNAVYGLAGSSVVVKNAALYMGACGENYGATVDHCVFDAPLPCPGGDNQNVHYGPITVIARPNTVSGSNQNNTFINRPEIAMRRKQLTAVANCFIEKGIFANWAMIANEKSTTTIYKNCLFAADAVWYFLEGTNELGNSWVSGGKKFDMRVDGAGLTTSAARQAALENWMRNTCGMSALPTFTDCIFSDKTIDEIFNNQSKGDYSPKMNSGADLGHGEYIGAFAPAKNIPFINATDNSGNGSAGTPETWDETTLSGCIYINQENNELELDDSSESTTGAIFSKIIKLDIFTQQINRLISAFTPQWRNRCAIAMKPTENNYLGNVFGITYGESDTLVAGYRYYVHGKILYMGSRYQTGDVVNVTSGMTLTFEAYEAGSTMTAINEHNLIDTVYCRCREKIYAYVTPSDTLQQGGVYYNSGNKNIVYHGRTIVPGESFVCNRSSMSFTCPTDNSYKVAVMFDDTRVPAATAWCPAALMDEYYVRKTSGAIVSDAFGVPYASGNPRAFSRSESKSTIDQTYTQFAIFVQRPFNIKAEADAAANME